MLSLSGLYSDIKSLDGTPVRVDTANRSDLVRISDSGVGINTAASAMLHVAGNAILSGNLSFNGAETLIISSPTTGSIIMTSSSLTTTGEYNTALGVQALNTTASGNDNTAIGYLSLAFNTSGNENTALGSQSLNNNTTGYQNVAIGDEALRDTTTGYRNVAIGADALKDNETGINNVAIGYQALQNSLVDDLVAVGREALENNTTGEKNVAVGTKSLQNLTSGDENTAVGYNALKDNTSRSYNTAIGAYAMEDTTNGEKSTALGREALRDGTDQDFVVALGYQSLRNSTGDYNVAVGAESLEALRSGSYNIAIGYKAGHNGDSDLDGSYNIIIGSQLDPSSQSASNELNIGAVIYGTGLYGTGMIGINNSTPGYTLDVMGNAQFSSNVVPANNGTANLGSSTKAWNNIYSVNTLNVISDKRVKKEVADLDYGLDAVMALRPVSYRLTNLPEPRKQLGLIAQEAKEVIEGIVNIPEDPNLLMSIRYSELVPVLIKATQEQQLQFQSLKSDNKKLKQRVLELESLVSELTVD